MNSDTAGDNTMSQEMEALEDRLDVALLRLARVEQANDESVPYVVVQRLSSGAVPTAVWREFRGLSQEELAASTALPITLIVEVERGKEDVPLRTMHSIARALRVDLDDLVPWTLEDGASEGAETR